MGTSLVVQRLQGMWVQSLVAELNSHMLWGQNIKRKEKIIQII